MTRQLGEHTALSRTHPAQPRGVVPRPQVCHFLTVTWCVIFYETVTGIFSVTVTGIFSVTCHQAQGSDKNKASPGLPCITLQCVMLDDRC